MLQEPGKYPIVSYHGGHTLYDGRDDPEQFVQAAINRNFLAFGFSEHMPVEIWNVYHDPGFEFTSNALRRFEQYVDTIIKLKTAYRSDLTILLGVEAEYIPRHETYLTTFLQQYPFDYIVGSVHFVRGLGIDFSQPLYDELIRTCGGIERTYVEYYRLIRDFLTLGIIDILAHLDLIKIFAPQNIMLDTTLITDAVLATLELVSEAAVILDVNTRGLLKPCHEIYPSLSILTKAHQLAIPAVPGDDSHAADEVGTQLHLAIELMRQACYISMTLILPGDSSSFRHHLSLKGFSSSFSFNC